EGSGLDDVDAGRAVAAVDLLDHVGARHGEKVVAAFLAAKVGGGQVERLDLRAHGAVTDQDALGEDVEISRAVGHRLPWVITKSIARSLGQSRRAPPFVEPAKPLTGLARRMYDRAISKVHAGRRPPTA